MLKERLVADGKKQRESKGEKRNYFKECAFVYDTSWFKKAQRSTVMAPIIIPSPPSNIEPIFIENKVLYIFLF